jgi:hypothetical protein
MKDKLLLLGSPLLVFATVLAVMVGIECLVRFLYHLFRE